MAQSIFGVQWQCLFEADCQHISILCKVSVFCSHHPKLPTNSWCPTPYILLMVVYGSCSMALEECLDEREVGKTTIAAHSEELLEQRHNFS